jgi:hypothetical protein
MDYTPLLFLATLFGIAYGLDCWREYRCPQCRARREAQKNPG